MRNVIIGKEGRVASNSQRAYKYYKSNAVHRDKEATYTHSKYSTIVNSFYKIITRDLLEKEGGVFIKNLGYFTIIRHPKKQVVKVNYKNGKEFFNTDTNNYLWTPTFFGFARGRGLLKFWTMDRTFSRVSVRKPLYERLIKGKTYKTFISTLSSLYLFNNNK